MQRLLFLAILALSQLAIGQSIPLPFPEAVRLAAKNSFKDMDERQKDSLLDNLASRSWKQKQQHDIEAAFFAVALVPSGRALLRGLLPLLTEKKIEIATVAKSGGTAGYYEDGKIYVNNEVPFVALVATLFHEGTHAVDWLSEVDGPARWKIFSTTRSRSET